MKLVEQSLPKKNSVENGGRESSLGLFFCTLEEGVERAQPRFGGKTLFVSEAKTMECFAPFARSLRAISVFFEADALPLFSMPDGVGSVFAAGGEETLKAARFFAKVRSLPCVLFPTGADLRGALEPEGEVLLCGEARRVALAQGEVCVDYALIASSLAEAFTSILLARLALIEDHALRIFSGAEKSAHFERAFALTALPVNDVSDVVLRNYALGKMRSEGAPAGEGETLFKLHRAAGDDYPVWRSYVELSALYGAFFECGTPRKFAVPDYSTRAKRAGVKYCRAQVPSVEEYAWRAEILERMRAGFYAELLTLLERREEYERVFRNLTGAEPPAGNLKWLKVLPEHAPHGLSAHIRDFGLMEF